MRLDSPVVAFPSWLAPRRPSGPIRGNARGGAPVRWWGEQAALMAQRRIALGLTQQQVADRLGICRESVSRAERRAVRSLVPDARALRTRARINRLYLALERAR